MRSVINYNILTKREEVTIVWGYEDDDFNALNGVCAVVTGRCSKGAFLM